MKKESRINLNFVYRDRQNYLRPIEFVIQSSQVILKTELRKYLQLQLKPEQISRKFKQ